MTGLQSRLVLQLIAEAAENGADAALVLAIETGMIPHDWHIESDAWKRAVEHAREGS